MNDTIPSPTLSDSELPTNPENAALSVPPPVTLEAIWAKLLKIEEEFAERFKTFDVNLDLIRDHVHAAVKQINDSDAYGKMLEHEERLGTVERVVGVTRVYRSNGAG